MGDKIFQKGNFRITGVNKGKINLNSAAGDPDPVDQKSPLEMQRISLNLVTVMYEISGGLNLNDPLDRILAVERMIAKVDENSNLKKEVLSALNDGFRLNELETLGHAVINIFWMAVENWESLES